MPESILLIFIGFAGLILTFYIHHKKIQTSEHFFCPLKGRCDQVIRSRYSTFLGIPVEILGMVYYALISVGYGTQLLYQGPYAHLLSIALFLASTFALVFSFYLTFLQFATLKKLCTWCLLSAGFCLSIFVLSVMGQWDLVIVAVWQAKEAIQLLFLFGVIFGVSAATFSLYFLIHFLKDFRISEDEASILDTFAQSIWLSIGSLLMTALPLYGLSASGMFKPLFILTMVVTGSLIIFNALLHLYLAPKFSNILFRKEQPTESIKWKKTRHIVFVLGPMSLVSWYVLFLLTTLETIPFSYQEGIVYYVSLLSLAAFVGHVYECMLDRSSKQTSC